MIEDDKTRRGRAREISGWWPDTLQIEIPAGAAGGGERVQSSLRASPTPRKH